MENTNCRHVFPSGSREKHLGKHFRIMFLEHTGIELIIMLLFLQMCSLFENTQYGIKNINSCRPIKTCARRAMKKELAQSDSPVKRKIHWTSLKIGRPE